jgi:hypothetical protein
VHEVASGRPSTQRRRSERVSKSLTVIVRGSDLLGQPFEERTSTVSVNLHGCRYASRHHLSRNSWITLELPHGNEFHSLRARVASVQRPQAIRDLFQISVELESPRNIWGIDSPPADWTGREFAPGNGETSYEDSLRGNLETGAPSDSAGNFMKGTRTPMNTSFGSAPAPDNPAEESAPMSDSPLLREWRVQFDQHLNRAVETASAQAIDQIRRAGEEVERKQAGARAGLSAWRERMETEMQLAQSQWSELLQSSLDNSIERLIKQVSGLSQEFLRSTEQAVTERVAEIREPLTQVSSAIKKELEEELWNARSSLAEIEHAAARIKDYAAQLETASHETLNELHRRLENMLETQTEELKRRGEELASGLRGRLAPTFDSLGQQLVERTMNELDAKIAPRIERIPELLRELTAREAEAEESLRLHRERLRQIAENSQREITGRVAATEAALRGDFENARKEALAKWSEELDSAGVRASHAAAESIGRSSEWFQQEARARTQVLIEQAIASAGSSFDEKTAVAAQAFVARLEEHSAGRLDEIKQRIDQTAERAAGEVAVRVRTKLDEAAETAAASFGQVLHGISDAEVEQFSNRSRGMSQERERELENFTRDLLEKIGSNATATLETFHAQLESLLSASISDARKGLQEENAAALESHRGEREAHRKEWTENLDRAGEEAAGKFQERLNNTSDSWLASSSRRLHEHGQGVIESLSRSADQALRASCSKLFEELSRILRDTVTDSGAAGFAPESPEPSVPPQ